MAQRLELDRQTVHIPAGDEVRILAVEQMELDEDVLENATEQRAHVGLAVGVRRSVVQNPLRVVRVAFEAAPIDVVLLPKREAFRLALRQLGAHRKVRLWQI